MAEQIELKNPWLVAVWPGMGQVAISAGFYLMAKLEMHLFAEFQAEELFDVEQVVVKNGLVKTSNLPRSRLFVWRDPEERHDIVVFIGEAQPPMGKYAFCRRLIRFAQELGVERVFTFAAMATQMSLEDPPRVFAAATDEESLAELRQMELEVLEEGNIGGLNGVLLGAAAEHGLRGSCLLGEMPHVFVQLPNPRASLAVLEAFLPMAGVQLDLTELREQADAVDEQLASLMDRVQQAMREQQQEAQPEASEFAASFEPPEEEQLAPEDERRIEDLFRQAEADRSKAYELKSELDRLNIFEDYEDRFLDLFKKPEG